MSTSSKCCLQGWQKINNFQSLWNQATGINMKMSTGETAPYQVVKPLTSQPFETSFNTEPFFRSRSARSAARFSMRCPGKPGVRWKASWRGICVGDLSTCWILLVVYQASSKVSLSITKVKHLKNFEQNSMVQQRDLGQTKGVIHWCMIATFTSVQWLIDNWDHWPLESTQYPATFF